MKYKVGDEVRIKGTDIGGTIESIIRGQLIVETKGLKIPVWPEEVVLIEGLVEKENTLSKNAKLVSERFAEDVNPSEFEHSQDIIMKMLLQGAINLPEGYQFVDENGNVINAMKIVLEKKKKEYPKTYEECAEIIAELTGSDCNPKGCMGYMSVQLTVLQKLLICRDAYWKIAGEEMGLGKPWEPDYRYRDEYYSIYYNGFSIIQCNSFEAHTFIFPTEKMRDAFYENFKELIIECQELL